MRPAHSETVRILAGDGGIAPPTGGLEPPVILTSPIPCGPGDQNRTGSSSLGTRRATITLRLDGAPGGNRTRDIELGKLALCCLSYRRLLLLPHREDRPFPGSVFPVYFRLARFSMALFGPFPGIPMAADQHVSNKKPRVGFSRRGVLVDSRVYFIGFPRAGLTARFRTSILRPHTKVIPSLQAAYEWTEGVRPIVSGRKGRCCTWAPPYSLYTPGGRKVKMKRKNRSSRSAR